MRQLTALLAFCIFTLSATAQTAYQQEWQEKWQNAADYTLQVAELMPASLYDYRPTADQMTFQRQLLHMAGNMYFIAHDMLGYEPEGYDHSAVFGLMKEGNSLSREETIGLLARGLEFAAAAVTALPADDLDTEVNFFAGPKTKRQMLTLLSDHLTHHRGQLVVYLRLNDLTPPRYLGW